jgi:hypothetical protein
MTVSWRRSAFGIVGTAMTATPQCGQYSAPASIGALHFTQECAVGAPHAVQYLAPATKLVPQLPHFATRLMALFPASTGAPADRCADPAHSFVGLAYPQAMRL